jgi:hypothetical protein
MNEQVFPTLEERALRATLKSGITRLFSVNLLATTQTVK